MLIGLDDGSAADVIITGDLPDEARLALLDLDVTADELRGKTLRWDDAPETGVPTAPTNDHGLPLPARSPWRVLLGDA